MLHVKQAVLLMAIVLAGSSAWAQTARSPLPSEALVNRLGLTRHWYAQAIIDPSRDKVKYMTSDEETLYLQSKNGILTAFDTETGTKRWATQVGRTDKPSFAATTNERFVFVPVSTKLVALEKDSGKIRWQIPLPGQPSTSAAVDEDRAYIGFFDGSAYAFDLKKVQELSEHGMLPQFASQAIVWRYRTSRQIDAPPVTFGETVLFASRSKVLLSVSAVNRDLIFQFETDEPVSAPLAKYKKSVLIASEDFNFYSVNILNGQIQWPPFPSGSIIRKAPHVIGLDVFLTPERGGMFRISVETGQQHWWKSGIENFVASSPSRVYAVDNLHNLMVLDRPTGDVQGGLRITQFPAQLKNDRTDRIYLSTSGGLVLCLREKDIEFPFYHLNPDQAPILPEFASEEEPPPTAEPEPGTDAPKPDGTDE